LTKEAKAGLLNIVSIWKDVTKKSLTLSGFSDNVGHRFYFRGRELVTMRGRIYPDKNGRFRVLFKGDWFYKDEHNNPFYHEKSAENFLAHLNELDRIPGGYDPSFFKKKSPYRFNEAFELYHETVRNDSKWHRKKYQYFVNYFKPHFKDMDIREIRELHIHGLINSMRRQGRGGKTIKNALTVLHAFLEFNRASMPSFPKFPEFRWQRPRIQWYTEKEIDHIFEFINPFDMPIFKFLCTYAVRPCEACGLKRDKVNWQTGEITIDSVFVDGQMKGRTKTSKVHALPILPEMTEYLRSSNDSFFVFSVSPGTYESRFSPYQNAGRSHYTVKMLEDRWNNAVEEAHRKYGVKKLSLYKMRHSWASQRRTQGYSLDQIGAVLGHSDPRVTQQNYADIGMGRLISIVRGK
jgi:integrase